MNGNRAIAKILKAEGVEWLAAFPMNALLDEAAKEGIRPIICRQERAGVNIADGFSRTTNGNRIGVFVMQYGAGRRMLSAASPKHTPTLFPCWCCPVASIGIGRKHIRTSNRRRIMGE